MEESEPADSAQHKSPEIPVEKELMLQLRAAQEKTNTQSKVISQPTLQNSVTRTMIIDGQNLVQRKLPCLRRPGATRPVAGRNPQQASRPISKPPTSPVVQNPAPIKQRAEQRTMMMDHSESEESEQTNKKDEKALDENLLRQFQEASEMLKQMQEAAGKSRPPVESKKPESSEQGSSNQRISRTISLDNE